MKKNELKNTSTMHYNEFWENPTIPASEQLAPLPAEIFFRDETKPVSLKRKARLRRKQSATASENLNELIELNLYQF